MQSRTVAWVLAVVAALVVFGLFLSGAFRGEGSREASAPVSNPASSGTGASSAPVVDPNIPVFDVVRINPSGTAVIAGRAAPGASVRVLGNEALLGEAMADQSGAWAFVTDKPLPPGDLSLSLEARQKPADKPIRSDRVVLVVVPERGPKDGAAVALSVGRDGKGGGRLLQSPLGAAAKDQLSIQLLEYDAAGALVVSGGGQKGMQVTLRIDGQPVGSAPVGEDGQWRIELPAAERPANFSLSATAGLAGGASLGTVRVAVALDKPITALPPGKLFVVQPGNSLWVMARRSYGDGVMYGVIFDANAQRIEDPDLIYPGQVFQVPNRPAASAAPSR
jgi:hypothetical protein